MADKGDIVSQSVPLEVGKAILPAFIVGYVLPTVMMFVPLGDISATQNMVAFWQPSPIYAAALTAIIAAFIRRARTNKTKSKSKTVRKTAESVSGPLKSAYAFAFVQFALAHVSLIGYIMSHPGLSLNHVFLDLPHPFGEWDLSDPTRAIFIFMKFDMLFYVLSVLVYLLYNIWDLMKLGCVSTQDATRATVATFAGQVLVGPGATYVGVWRWREEALTKLKS